jgi:hypothetical protein
LRHALIDHQIDAVARTSPIRSPVRTRVRDRATKGSFEECERGARRLAAPGDRSMDRTEHPAHAATPCLVSLLVGATLPIAASAAWAQVEPIGLTYTAPAECPGEQQLRSEISARTSRARIGAKPGGGRLFRASIEPRGGELVGTLRIDEPSGSGTPRQVRAAQCADVTSALALMIAVAIDPRASTVPASALPRTPAAPAQTSAALAASVSPSGSWTLAAPRPPEAPAPAPRAEAASWTWAAGASALVLGGIAPDLGVGGVAFAEAGHEVAGRPGLAVRAGAAYADSGLTGGESREATMRWIAARLALCPAPIQVSPPFSLGACLDADLGGLRAEGRGVAHPRADMRPFAALGLSARAQVRPSRTWFVELGGGVWSPLTRNTFVFEEPRRVVYEMPRVGWSLAAGAGLRFL